MRGEKDRDAEQVGAADGSSPRAWGKEVPLNKSLKSPRIIPTCVGKSVARRLRPRKSSDHPHVRGEKHPSPPYGAHSRGSSPRAWGKGITCPLYATGERIIPTCVGKRNMLGFQRMIPADHPHVRGEKLFGIPCHRL